MVTAIQPDNQEQVDDLIATNRAAIRVQYHGVNNTKMKFIIQPSVKRLTHTDASDDAAGLLSLAA